VCHLNLHKTYVILKYWLTVDFVFLTAVEAQVLAQSGCIVLLMIAADISKSHLAPYLPGHPLKDSLLHSTSKSIEPQAAAPFGSASILLISYAYIKMMGAHPHIPAFPLANLRFRGSTKSHSGSYVKC